MPRPIPRLAPVTRTDDIEERVDEGSQFTEREWKLSFIIPPPPHSQWPRCV